MDFMVTTAQVNFQTCNWWFADQNLPIKFSLNFVNWCQQRNNHKILLFNTFQTRYRFEQFHRLNWIYVYCCNNSNNCCRHEPKQPFSKNLYFLMIFLSHQFCATRVLTAVIKAPVVTMGHVYVMIITMELTAQVNQYFFIWLWIVLKMSFYYIEI